MEKAALLAAVALILPSLQRSSLTFRPLPSYLSVSSQVFCFLGRIYTDCLPTPGLAWTPTLQSHVLLKTCDSSSQGLNILIPVLDRIRYVQSLKEIVINVPEQSAVTLGEECRVTRVLRGRQAMVAGERAHWNPGS